MQESYDNGVDGSSSYQYFNPQLKGYENSQKSTHHENEGFFKSYIHFLFGDGHVQSVSFIVSIVCGVLLILHTLLTMPLCLLWAFISLFAGEWETFLGVNFNLSTLLFLFIAALSALFGIVFGVAVIIIALIGRKIPYTRMGLLIAHFIYFLLSLFTLVFAMQYWYLLVHGSASHRTLSKACKEAHMDDCPGLGDYSWMIVWGLLGLGGLILHEFFNKLIQLVLLISELAPAYRIFLAFFAKIFRLTRRITEPEKDLYEEESENLLPKKNVNANNNPNTNQHQSSHHQDQESSDLSHFGMDFKHQDVHIDGDEHIGKISLLNDDNANVKKDDDDDDDDENEVVTL